MKAVVVAGGELDPTDVAQIDAADLVVAADAGAALLEAAGRRPDLVVGDLDSTDPALIARLEAAGVPVERHAVEKDASDAELAIERAIAAAADEVVLLGALGGLRLDHALANVLLVTEPAWREVRLRLVRGPTSVQALHGGDSVRLVGAAGDLVTLLPVAGEAVGVRTSGLRWPLAGETLRPGRSRGLSNEVVAADASVQLERGVLLVVETQQGGGT